MSQIAKLEPGVFQVYSDEVVNYVLDDILKLKVGYRILWTELTHEQWKKPVLKSAAEISVQCQSKLLALEFCESYFLSLAANNSTEYAEKAHSFFNVLFKIIETGNVGEGSTRYTQWQLTTSNYVSEIDKENLRQQAVITALKLACNRFFDKMISPKHFVLLASATKVAACKANILSARRILVLKSEMLFWRDSLLVFELCSYLSVICAL